MAEAVSVKLERRLAAPPEAVFDAWLNPESLGQWLFRTPAGTLQRVDVDPRIGGRFRVDEKRDGEIAEHHGEYVELDRPHRLAFDFWTSFSAERTRVTIEIAPAAGGALLKLTHEGVWPDWADKSRMGWTMILDGLERSLT